MSLKEKIKEIINYEGSNLQKYRNNKKTEKLRSQRRKLMNEVGIEALSLLFDTARKFNKSIWLEFGTLLGSYREHDFIKHDYDIDLGMDSNDFTMDFEDMLLGVGFSKKRAFYQYNSDTKTKFLTEICIVYKEYPIDIFFSFNAGENQRNLYVYGLENEQFSKQNIYNVRQYTLPSVGKLEETNIKNLVAYAPQNPNETLKIIYGENFMHLDPNWNTTKSKLNVKLFNINERQGFMYGKW